MCPLEERPPRGPVVVDDLRYPQEVRFFRELGAKILRIYRPGVEAPDTGHEAEKHELPVDATVFNNSTIAELEVGVHLKLSQLGLKL